MQDVTEDFVRAIFKRDADPTALLVTINAPGLDGPIYATSNPDGMTSRGVDYEYFPFSFSWGGSSADEPVRQASLEIGNTDGRIAEAVRLATGNPLATVELVRLAAPDTVEIGMVDAKIADVEIDDPKVTANLKPKSFADEPACQARYIIARVPGLFA